MDGLGGKRKKLFNGFLRFLKARHYFVIEVTRNFSSIYLHCCFLDKLRLKCAVLLSFGEGRVQVSIEAS